MSAARRIYRRPSRAIIAAGTALATLATYAGLSAISTPARAADLETLGLTGVLDSLATTFVPSLETVGELGDTIPTTRLRPGGASGLGLGDLLTQVRTDLWGGSGYGGAADLNALRSQLDHSDAELSDGTHRHVAVTAISTPSAGRDLLSLALHITRTTTTGLDVTTIEPPVTVSSADGLSASLVGDFALTLAWDTAAHRAYLVAGPGAPSLRIATTVTIPTPSAVKAGLGILGVELGSGTTYDAAHTVTTTWSDPNNDGQLAFSEPDGAGGTRDGELRAAGAGAGLVSAPVTAGHANAVLQLVGRSDASILNLPTVSASISVNGPDLTAGDPTVTPTDSSAFDAVSGFLALSPRDLAQGLASVAAAITAVEQGQATKLPFMRGSLVDAIPAAEAIKDFLAEHVTVATDPEHPGFADFPSLQDLLTELANDADTLASGASFDIANAAFAAASNKVAFDLSIHQTSTTARPLDPAAPALTGTGTHVTYSPSTLRDTDKNFDPVVDGRHDFRDQLRGRQITVGGSSAIILDAAGDTLTLDPAPLTPAGGSAPAVRWQGGTPANGAPYSIANNDPKTGVVELGDALATDGHIRNANATQPNATFTPTYDVTIPIAIDVRPPNTTDCDPGPGTGCPFRETDAVSGISRLVTSVPAAPDRILIRTGHPLLTADAPVNANIDLNATVGFVGVHVTGTLGACTTQTTENCTGTPASGTHLLDVSLLTPPSADTEGDLNLTDFFTALRTDPTHLFHAAVNGQAFASLSLDVPGASDFFGGTTPTVTVAMPNITAPTTLQVTGPALDKILPLDFDPSNPQALFGALLAGLQELQGSIGSIPGADVKIPVLGTSLSDAVAGGPGNSGDTVTYTTTGTTHSVVDSARTFDATYVGRKVHVGTQDLDVVGFTQHSLLVSGWTDQPADHTAYSVDSELQGLLNLLASHPSDSLQQMLTALAAQLGGGSSAAFKVLTGSTNVLELTLDWKRSYKGSVPIQLDFGSHSLVGASATGQLSVEASGEVKAVLRMDLTPAAAAAPLDHLLIDPSQSFVDAHVGINGDGQLFSANLGPFSASLGAPTGPSGTKLRAALGARLQHSGATTPETLSAFAAGLTPALSTSDGVTCSDDSAAPKPLLLCADLPVYINGGPVSGDPATTNLTVRLPKPAAAGDSMASLFDLSGPDTDEGPRLVTPDLSQLLTAGIDFSALQDGIGGYLRFIEQSMRAASFNGKLPLIGQDLQAGSAWVGNLRTAFDGAGIGAIDPSAQASDIQSALQDAVNAAAPNVAGLDVVVLCSGSPCAPNASGAAITGVTVEFNAGQGTLNSYDGCVAASDCLEATLPVNLGIPGLSIRSQDPSSGITGRIGWHLHLKLGFDRSEGFFIDTVDPAGPELQLGAALSVPNATHVNLAFLDVGVEKAHPDTPEFAGLFTVDLHKGGSGHLTLADMAGDVSSFVTPRLTAKALIDWNLKATADPLPGVGAEFVLDWEWASDAPSASDPTSNLKTLDFRHVSIDPGAFLGSALKDVVTKINDVFKPVQPIIDTILAPIPVISDLSHAVGGGDVSIATLAEAYSTLGDVEGIDTLITVLKAVKTLNTALNGTCGGGETFCIDLGSFSLMKSKSLSTVNSPDTAAGLIDPAHSAPSPQNAQEQLDGKTGGALSAASEADHGRTLGFTFPALSNPSSLFGLILGQDVELAHFDSGPMTLGFEFSQSFGPVYAPPPVMVVISGGASVSLRIAAGFDTYGIRKAVEAGSLNASVLDSLYFVTTEDGKPIPVVQFTGFLAAGASVSLVVIEVGIEGGIQLTVNFTWNDPNNDGKFRFGEFLATAINNPICLFNVGGELSLFIKVFVTLGISPFSVSFDFTLINIKLLDFSLKPNCTPPPPRLAGVKDGTLYLFAGKLGTNTERGAPWAANGADETWVVREVAAVPASGTDPAVPKKVVVQGLGITEEYLDSQVTSVVFDGRGYTGKLKVLFQGGSANQPFDKTTYVFGGDGEDVIRTGSGASYVDGGKGADQITTIDRPLLDTPLAGAPAAVVAGGADGDTVSAGNATDWIAGDSALTFGHAAVSDVHNNGANVNVNLADVITPGTVGHPTDPASGSFGAGNDGPDVISVGLGGGTIYGGNGDDTIGTANDSSQLNLPAIKNGTEATKDKYRAHTMTIVGGKGGDRIKSGSASDNIHTGDKHVITSDNDAGGADAVLGATFADHNTVDTGVGADNVYGSTIVDLVTTHSNADQTASIWGGGGNDVLTGGAGSDLVEGGPGNDYLIAEPATVSGDTPVVDGLPGSPARSVTHLPLTSAPSQKKLVGGGGSDRIYGGDGPANIFGDHEIDGCAPQTDPVSAQPGEHPTESGPADNQDAADLILGGAGVDTVQAGGGDDYVYTYGGNDVVCGNKGLDRVYAGAGTDLVYGGSGNDILYGEDGADELYGNDDNDTAYGQLGDDRIQGNNGVDTLFGGLGDDLVVGGSSKAGLPDAGDFLYGDEGADRIVGDNSATDTLADAYPTDLDGATPSAGGADWLFGGAQDDRAYGGLDVDYVFGGDGADHLEGNNGHDHAYGEAGADDIIGGSSQVPSGGDGVGGVGRPDDIDDLDGGAADDVIAGDNAVIEKVASGGSTLTRGGRLLTSERSIRLLDLGYGPATGLFGGDNITGAAGDDLVFGERGDEVIHGATGDDYLEGGQGSDTIDGDDGQDDLVGGSYSDQSTRQGQLDTGDTIRGGNDGDVAIGDNGLVTRDSDAAFSDLVAGRGVAGRSITLYDVGDTPTLNTSGSDWIQGQDGVDVLLGQAASDRVQGGTASDYVEGGPAADWLEGNSGSDDVVGGSSERLAVADSGDDASGQTDAADVMWGGSGDDVVTGDNARVTRVEPYNDLTNRIGTLVPGQIEERRSIRLLDLRNAGSVLTEPSGTRFGGDFASGQEGNDVILGQDGNDYLSGGSDDDYVEGQGGAELILGDVSLAAGGVSVVDPVSPTVGSPTAGYAADLGSAGQDDLMGGSSRQGFRDKADEVHGNGAADFILGDGGTIVRYVDGSPGSLVDRVNAGRYPSTPPAGAAKLRHADSHFPSTRFCTLAQTSCEPTGAFGGDLLYGDAGDDVMYGQDGQDKMWGGTGDDDMFGELDNDNLWGEDGEDAILGDRGGLVDTYQSGSSQFTIDNSQVPKIHYDGFVAGMVTRKVDLLHDNDGAAFVGSGSANPMPHGGMLEGGDDRIRGGNGRDSVHAGFGEDVVNGDSGGDTIFGDDGADVMWGGRGVQDVTADPNTRGAYDSNVDYIFGGKGGATDGTKKGTLGADIIDWRPRGSYGTPGPTTCAAGLVPQDYVVNQKATNTVDPCLWFEFTDITGVDATKYQHHQGIDWIYGGWDRDVLQADVADNGPNMGDRLLDWNGAFNIYTHCNSAYGGFNDVRQHSPTQQDFLQRWSWSMGAGQVQSDAVTGGTSAFDELALVYPGSDNDHGSGPAFPGTPGHFDNPNACAP